VPRKFEITYNVNNDARDRVISTGHDGQLYFFDRGVGETVGKKNVILQLTNLQLGLVSEWGGGGRGLLENRKTTQ